MAHYMLKINSPLMRLEITRFISTPHAMDLWIRHTTIAVNIMLINLFQEREGIGISVMETDNHENRQS